MKTKKEIAITIQELQNQLQTSCEIDDTVIEGLTLLNKLRTLYKEDRSLFDNDLIQKLQTLKKDIENIDECFELIYDDFSKYNCKQLEKIKEKIPKNNYLLSLIDEKIKQFEKDLY